MVVDQTAVNEKVEDILTAINTQLGVLVTGIDKIHNHEKTDFSDGVDDITDDLAALNVLLDA